jgi:glycosyltransferase involved in cell wall biosynthesis
MTGSEHGGQTLTTHGGPATDRPRFTIVTASFNALAGLRRTVENVAAQDFPDVEHVIVDGGSSDGSREYLESQGQKLRWISEPDEGIADALNKGIAMATGDYILVLQAEDVFVDTASLSSVARDLGDTGRFGTIDIAAYEVILDFGDRTVLRKARPLGWLSSFKMTCPHQGMFVARSLYARIGSFDASYRVAMDYEWLLRARNAGARLLAFSRPVAIMPATGVSTQTGWSSVARRLDEDRRLQDQHATSGLQKMASGVFWSVYRPFKQVKARIGSGPG